MQIAKEQKRPVVWVEVALNQVAQFEQLEVVALGWVGTLDEPFERTAETTPPTQCRERTIASDPEQPRLGIVDLRQLAATTECFVEAVLEQILGQRPVADHLGEEAAKAGLRGVKELLDNLRASLSRRALGRTPPSRFGARGQNVDLFSELPHLSIQVPKGDLA